MNNVTTFRGVVHRPRIVVQFSDPGMLGHFDGPLRVLINPTMFGLDRGFAIGVHHDINTSFLEAFGKMGYKQFGSAVIRRRDGNKGCYDERDVQLNAPPLTGSLEQR
jgi:hypothetical protein